MKSVQSVTCKRKVVFNHIVTETFKLNTIIEIQNNLNQIQNNINQLDQIIKKILSEANGKQPDLKQIEQERFKLQAQKKITETKLEEVKKLKEGDTFTANQMEGFCTLKQGDDIREKLGAVTILCKDYQIQDMSVEIEEEIKETSIQPIPISV